MKPLQLKIRRTNSFFGTWKCEEVGKNHLRDAIGIDEDIQRAIDDFLWDYKTIHGFTPNYKWS